MRKVAIVSGLVFLTLIIASVFGMFGRTTQSSMFSVPVWEDNPMMLWWLPIGAAPLFGDLWKRLSNWVQKKGKGRRTSVVKNADKD